MPRTQLTMNAFVRTLWAYHKTHRRSMRWRHDTRPYYIVVSEIMLQQTQVDRVVRKFDTFVATFPDWNALANASTSDVLRAWSGLGYNRRALYLKKIADSVVGDPAYHFLDHTDTPAIPIPTLISLLRALPGIGPNTAGSILAFAYNIPHPFIETNIRSVFIHFFFPEITKRGTPMKKISDDQLMPLIRLALEHPDVMNNAREWYYALMDYGSHLKKNIPNPSQRSAHHVRQKPFKGSNRELRSRILALILENPLRTEHIYHYFKKENIPIATLEKNLNDLKKEGFLSCENEVYSVR